MKIKFKDINTGIVQARASLEISPGVMVNEITILKKGPNIIVELPQKSFKGRQGKIFYIDIITFASENKEHLWKLEVKNEYIKWRKANPKIEVYESE